jgi:exopolysaccharide biosynthesis polyprenyl glycosylphosphotransferase
LTPPPAATHTGAERRLLRRRTRDHVVSRPKVRILDARSWSRVRCIVDAAALSLAAIAAVVAAPTPGRLADLWLALVFPPVALAVIHARRNPDERLFGSALDTVAHVLGTVSLTAMLSIAADSILGGAHPVGIALRLWLFAFFYVGVARLVLLSIRRQVMCTEALSTPTLIVGAGVVGEQLAKRLLAEPRYGLCPVGFLDLDPLQRSDDASSSLVPVIGGLDDLPEAVVRTGARHVILAFSSEPDHVLVDKVKECQHLGIGVSLVPRLYESINEHAMLDHVGGIPLLSLRPTDPRGWQFAVKHGIDRSLAMLALLVLAPLMIAIAAAVKLSSPGPVLFRQLRVGRDGHAFHVFKFRTMRESIEAAYFSPPTGLAPGGIEGLDRRTRIGQWLRGASLDELPQLINVLRGDMSLVGPRPERPEYVELFERDVARYEDRHRVKSGITGWAQVHGLRGQTPVADRVEWDNYYVRNWSLGLDLRIIALTVAEVLRFRG